MYEYYLLVKTDFRHTAVKNCISLDINRSWIEG
jgi:hypothetical protein